MQTTRTAAVVLVAGFVAAACSGAGDSSGAGPVEAPTTTTPVFEG